MSNDNNIYELAVMLRGSSDRFLKSLVHPEAPAEETAAAWNELDMVMLELRRQVAVVMSED